MTPDEIATYMKARLDGYGDSQVDDFVTSVTREIVPQGYEWAMKRWRIILESLDIPRFSPAIFSEAISHSFLALSSDHNLTRKIAEVEAMTDESFELAITKKHQKYADPPVSSPQQSPRRPPSTPIPGLSHTERGSSPTWSSHGSGDRVPRAQST